MLALAGDALDFSTFRPVGIAVWMNTWLSQIIGVAKPLPGILTFHRMFFVSLQAVGGFPAGATPVPKGPRHCGQFSVAEDAAARVVRMLANGTEVKSATHNHLWSHDRQRWDSV